MSVKITTLDSGVTVVSHPMAQLETVAMGIWVEAGSRDEAPAQNGIAHLLEHMAFKGTPRRTARQIVEEIETAGGDINASTSMESTGFYARVLKQDWPLALDILSDILLNPVFDEHELEREKDVVLQEIAASLDTPDDLVFDLAQACAYDGHALGRTILGEPRQVSRYRAGDLVAYRDRHYTGGRMVLAAAGRIEHDELVAKARTLLAPALKGDVPERSVPHFKGGSKFIRKRLDQTHLVISLPGPGYRNKDIYAFQMLAGILGGGMSSRLFQDVREKRGLCYSVYSYVSALADAGQFSFYAGAAPGKAAELTDVACDVIRSAGEGVSADEVNRARAQIKAGLVMSLESAQARADQIARQYMAFGKVPAISSIIAKVDAVTPDQIKALAKRLFAGAPVAYAAVGGIKQLASYDRVVAKFN